MRHGTAGVWQTVQPLLGTALLPAPRPPPTPCPPPTRHQTHAGPAALHLLAAARSGDVLGPGAHGAQARLARHVSEGRAGADPPVGSRRGEHHSRACGCAAGLHAGVLPTRLPRRCCCWQGRACLQATLCSPVGGCPLLSRLAARAARTSCMHPLLAAPALRPRCCAWATWWGPTARAWTAWRAWWRCARRWEARSRRWCGSGCVLERAGGVGGCGWGAWVDRGGMDE